MATRCKTCDHHLESISGEKVCLSCSHDKLVAFEAFFARAGIEIRGDDGKTLPPMRQAWDHGRPVLHFGLPAASACEGHEYWVNQLNTWHQNGTFARLNDAMVAKQPVQVRRSDGTICVGVITATAGFAGLTIEVEFDTPDGLRYKSMPTEDFLELNPGFGPHLLELEPQQKVAEG
jgi:hypothetical protein